MSKIHLYENLSLMAIGLLIAVAGIYSYKLFSFLLPALTIIVIWFQGGIKKISFSPPIIFLGLLLIWAGVSILWSVSPLSGLKTFIALSLTFLFALILLSCLNQDPSKFIPNAYNVIKVSGFFLMLFIIFQSTVDWLYPGLFTGDSSRSYLMKPTGSILGLTAFVGCAFIGVYKNNVLLAFVVFILVSLLAYLTRCQTALYGLILSTIIFILSYAIPFWATRVAMIFVYTFLIFSPITYVYMYPPSRLVQIPILKNILNFSLYHRFLSWEFYSIKFLESPFLGWGIESSRYLPTEDSLAKGYSNVIHPHNNSAQAYAELGVIGGILYALFFASLFWLVEKNIKDRLSVAVCNATIVFGFVAAEITHNIWRNYWLSLVALTVGLIILFLKAREGQLRAEAGRSKQALTQ